MPQDMGTTNVPTPSPADMPEATVICCDACLDIAGARDFTDRDFKRTFLPAPPTGISPSRAALRRQRRPPDGGGWPWLVVGDGQPARLLLGLGLIQTR